MKQLEYSPLVRKKLLALHNRLNTDYGAPTARKNLQGILNDADHLSYFPQSGTNISRIYEIKTEYWYIFTHHYYLIYRIESEKVIIVQMFHEKEDFMMRLFGISGRTQESVDYWGE